MLDLRSSELVLTSADFGDAYLRDGWASQYIEDRMRLGILVLVGYRAEDAALRLLLETLDADRNHFRDLKDIYVIEKSSAGSASVDCMGFNPIGLRAAVEMCGVDRVVFGSDYGPIPYGIKEHVQIVEDVVPSPAQRQQVFWKTSNKVFRLGLIDTDLITPLSSRR